MQRTLELLFFQQANGYYEISPWPLRLLTLAIVLAAAYCASRGAAQGIEPGTALIFVCASVSAVLLGAATLPQAVEGQSALTLFFAPSGTLISLGINPTSYRTSLIYFPFCLLAGAWLLLAARWFAGRGQKPPVPLSVAATLFFYMSVVNIYAREPINSLDAPSVKVMTASVLLGMFFTVLIARFCGVATEKPPLFRALGSVCFVYCVGNMVPQLVAAAVGFSETQNVVQIICLIIFGCCALYAAQGERSSDE